MLRPRQLRADRGRLKSFTEEIGLAVGEDRESIAHMPTHVVVGQSEVGAKVVAVGVGEVGDVGIEREPIDDVLVARLAALGLQPIVHAEPHGFQIVGNFAGRRGDRVLNTAAERIKPRVEFRVDER